MQLRIGIAAVLAMSLLLCLTVQRKEEDQLNAVAAAPSLPDPHRTRGSPKPQRPATAPVAVRIPTPAVPAPFVAPSTINVLDAPPPTSSTKSIIALGIQCDLGWLSRWRALFDALSPESRAAFSVFVYVIGRDAASQSAALRSWAAADGGRLVVFATTTAAWQRASFPSGEALPPPPDTWTTGRNVLARAMYAFEVARGRQFGWWAMADADTAVLSCEGCPPGAGDAGAASRSACCFLHAFTAARALPFASVGTLGWGIESHPARVAAPTTFWVSPRIDGTLQVFHRRAAPVLLPYHEELDSASWWASQYFVFWYAQKCLPGATAGEGSGMGGGMGGGGVTDSRATHTVL